MKFGRKNSLVIYLPLRNYVLVIAVKKYAKVEIIVSFSRHIVQDFLILLQIFAQDGQRKPILFKNWSSLFPVSMF